MVDQRTANRRTESEVHSAGKKRPHFLRYLELPLTCSEKDVQLAYRKMARVCHPDHGGNVARFRELRNNYEAALRFARQQPTKPFSSNNYRLDPFRFAGQPYRLNKRTVFLVVGIVSFVLVVAASLGKGLLVFSTLFFLVTILLGPISASGFRPVYTGFFFAGTCFAAMAFLVGGTQAGIFDFIFAHDFFSRELASNELYVCAALLFAIIMMLSAFASWLISLAAHDY